SALPFVPAVARRCPAAPPPTGVPSDAATRMANSSGACSLGRGGRGERWARVSGAGLCVAESLDILHRRHGGDFARQTRGGGTACSGQGSHVRSASHPAGPRGRGGGETSPVRPSRSLDDPGSSRGTPPVLGFSYDRSRPL